MSRGKPRIGISSCLLGRRVRHDGQHKRDAFLVEVLGPFVEWVPVCPELEVGMGVPREPVRLVGPAGAPRMRAERSGRDWTEAMAGWSDRRVEDLAGLDPSGYVTKKDSPSCGMERVRRWPERGGPPRRDGVGAFARVLMARLPLLPVEEEGRLGDPHLRESFVERVFAYARWKAALEAGMTRGALVRFHTVHELALLAHSPDAYRKLGRIVAGLGKGRIDGAAESYGSGFMAALKVPARRGRHANVLQHMLGYFREVLETADRRELEASVKDYQRGLVPLILPLTLIRHHVRRHGIAWLADQVYLDPDPKELMLRNHV